MKRHLAFYCVKKLITPLYQFDALVNNQDNWSGKLVRKD